MATLEELLNDNKAARGVINDGQRLGMIEVWESTEHPGYWHYEKFDVGEGCSYVTRRPIKKEWVARMISCSIDPSLLTWEETDRTGEGASRNEVTR